MVKSHHAVGSGSGAALVKRLTVKREHILFFTGIRSGWQDGAGWPWEVWHTVGL